MSLTVCTAVGGAGLGAAGPDSGALEHYWAIALDRVAPRPSRNRATGRAHADSAGGRNVSEVTGRRIDHGHVRLGELLAASPRSDARTVSCTSSPARRSWFGRATALSVARRPLLPNQLPISTLSQPELLVAKVPAHADRGAAYDGGSVRPSYSSAPHRRGCHRPLVLTCGPARRQSGSWNLSRP